MITNAEIFHSISEAFAERSGEHFTLDALEELLSGYPVDCDAYDLKAVREAVGHPTNWGSFEYVYDWHGDGETLAGIFNSNVLRTVYIVDCGELRNICRGDRANETPIWRPCGHSRVIGHYDDFDGAKRAYDATDPMDEWFESVRDRSHAAYVEIYCEQLTVDGKPYGTGRIDEKTFYLTSGTKVA